MFDVVVGSGGAVVVSGHTLRTRYVSLAKRIPVVLSNAVKCLWNANEMKCFLNAMECL